MEQLFVNSQVSENLLKDHEEISKKNLDLLKINEMLVSENEQLKARLIEHCHEKKSGSDIKYEFDPNAGPSSGVSQLKELINDLKQECSSRDLIVRRTLNRRMCFFYLNFILIKDGIEEREKTLDSSTSQLGSSESLNQSLENGINEGSMNSTGGKVKVSMSSRISGSFLFKSKRDQRKTIRNVFFKRIKTSNNKNL